MFHVEQSDIELIKVSALTVWQPWASLIMIGAKPYEYRRWPAPRSKHGHRIVIHAGARRVNLKEVRYLIWQIGRDKEAAGGIGEAALPLLERLLREEVTLPLGVGLGTAVLGEPVKASALYPDSERVDHHMWGWPLSNPRTFEPVIPCRGFQGFWPWPWKVAA